MRKIRALIGMPVVVNNRRAGRVVQVELSGDLRRMEGVWMDAGLRGTRFISADSIAMLGKVAVMADDPVSGSAAAARRIFRRRLARCGRLGSLRRGNRRDDFRVCALDSRVELWTDC